MKNEEFVKIVKKYGTIKPVQEAFNDYPAEEEEHQGKLESYVTIREEQESYYSTY